MDDQPKYAGMTTNERLYAAGLLDIFDDAARRRDAATMVTILLQVEIDRPGAEWITETVLANPERYGF